jgi:hypothetical protein
MDTTLQKWLNDGHHQTAVHSTEVSSDKRAELEDSANQSMGDT